MFWGPGRPEDGIESTGAGGTGSSEQKVFLMLSHPSSSPDSSLKSNNRHKNPFAGMGDHITY